MSCWSSIKEKNVPLVLKLDLTAFTFRNWARKGLGDVFMMVDLGK